MTKSPLSKTAASAGFTLLEILISVAIMSVMLTAIFSARTGLFVTADLTGEMAEVSNRVFLELQKLERHGESILAGTEDGGFEEGDELALLEDAKWKRVVEITSLKISPDNSAFAGALIPEIPIKKVTYTITWKNKGKERDFSSFILFGADDESKEGEEDEEESR